jgi:hypothetical protein
MGSFPAYCAHVGGLRCVDGSSLAVIPVPALDRGGTPFEVTLQLERDGESFGTVGQRCGFFLAEVARRLAAARAQESGWPDEDRFPSDRSQRELELFAFRYRDRGDLASTGELRCTLRTTAYWVGAQEGGRWRRARRAVLEAWGAGGRGVRAVLTSSELADFLDELLDEAAQAGASYRELTMGTSVGLTRR